MKRLSQFVVMLIGLPIFYGCASAPVPAERMAASESGVRAAEEVGAKDVPNAAFYLQLAKEQIEHAQTLIKKGDNDRAKWILMRAESDAELSVALAKENNTKADAQQAVDQVHQIQQGGTF